MSNNDLAEVSVIMSRFNDLANQIKEEGVAIEKISTALMLASCNYSTYIAAGNDGYLEPSGIEKLSAAYKRNLTQLQAARKKQLNPDG
ncbi:MAG: DUF3144 domain-containing protein [bacterium]